MKIIQSALLMPKVTLEIIQKVAGIINILVLMCLLLRFLCTSIIAQLSDAYSTSPLYLGSASAKFFNLWLHIFEELRDGFPIACIPRFLPAMVPTFVSDAAGLPEPTKVLDFDISVGAAGYYAPFSKIFYVGQVLWPLQFLQ